ncbi:facilitated trehalose transporter Tret1-2 homolog [Cloeon dipterum]|uniref:facilitated trehalose transporter Tret1-2 homolog n=1 Tax=Cloeon dipterum TaxID=197152 RepID=UPI003220844A
MTTGPQGRILREENSRTALTAMADGADDDNTSGSDSSLNSGNGSCSTAPQYFAAALATLSAFSAGTILGWSSPALPILEGADSPVPIDVDQGSWLGSLLTLGALMGAAPAGAVSQVVGRQRLLVALSLPLLASWLMLGLSTSVAALYVGRFLGGLATGAVSVVAPIYCAEIAEQKCRGALGTLFQLQLVVGILFAYVVGAVAPINCFAYTCALVPALFMVTFVWMPETPQFLLSRGRRFAAEQSLQWLRGGDGCDVQKELLVMQSSASAADASSMSGASSLVLDPATRKALFVSLGLMALQQLSGINAVVFYSGSIFDSAGGTLSPSVASIVIATVMVAATACSALLVDKAGRRPLLLLSAALMAACLAALAVSFSYTPDLTAEDAVRPDWLNWLPVLSVAVYIVAFSIGFGPIPWMMMGELFSDSAKSSASAVAASCNWGLAFAVTKSFQSLVDALGSTGAFAFFAAVCVAAIFFTLFVVPETKGKSSEQIQLELTRRKHSTILPV